MVVCKESKLVIFLSIEEKERFDKQLREEGIEIKDLDSLTSKEIKQMVQISNNIIKQMLGWDIKTSKSLSSLNKIIDFHFFHEEKDEIKMQVIYYEAVEVRNLYIQES